MRRGALIVTYPEAAIKRGLGDDEKPLQATLYGEPEHGRATARLADGTHVRYVRGEWSTTSGRNVEYRTYPNG